MAGVHSPTQSVSNGAVYAARAAASIHAQESQEVSGGSFMREGWKVHTGTY